MVLTTILRDENFENTEGQLLGSKWIKTGLAEEAEGISTTEASCIVDCVFVVDCTIVEEVEVLWVFCRTIIRKRR